MGKKRTTVNTAISRVITDDQLPNSVMTGVLRALFQRGQIVDEVIDELVSGLGVRAERMYRYAKNGDYAFGVPSGQFANGETGYAEIDAVLTTLEGAAVALDYAHHGNANNLHVGWMTLIADHGYDTGTNVLGDLTTSLGTTVWLKDMQLVVPETESDNLNLDTLRQFGIAARAGYTPQRSAGTPETRALIRPSEIQLEVGGTTEYLRVIHTRQVAGVATEGSFDIPITGTVYDDATLEYFHARYVVGGVAKYWMYLDGAGTYPTLDELYDLPAEAGGNFFPFIYFRHNKTSEVDNKTTEAYRTSKKLVKYLGMKYDDIGEGVNSNPGIADVETALMMFAVPGNTTQEIERRYLFEFFEQLFLSNPTDQQLPSETAADIYGNQYDRLYVAAPVVVIQDTRFKMQIDNEGIFKRTVAGSIGAVGTHSSSFTADTKIIHSTYTLLVDDVPVVYDLPLPTPWNSHYYRKQVSTGFYEEIRIINLRSVFWVFEGWTTVGDDEDLILLIPVDHSIVHQWSLPDRELLYARSMHYVFNSLIQVKVKWYQTGLFQVVMIIVMLVIAYFTMGSTFAALGAALSAGAYAAAAMIILEMVVTMLVTQLVFKLIVKAVGVEFAFYLAIAAALVSGYAEMGGTFAGVAGAPWAGQLLTISTGLTQAIQGQLKANMLDLVNQAREFDLYKADQIKVLETGQKLLEHDTRLDPFVIFGEKPGDFYNRTVHSGNIGVIGGIGAISSYVDIALSLPRLDESLEMGGST